MVSGGGHYFWLGASADADPALVASDRAAERLDPPGIDPLREKTRNYCPYVFGSGNAPPRCQNCDCRYGRMVVEGFWR